MRAPASLTGLLSLALAATLALPAGAQDGVQSSPAHGEDVSDEGSNGLVLHASGVDHLELGGHLRGRADLRDPMAPLVGASSDSLNLLRVGVDLDVQVDEYIGGFLEFHERVGAAGAASKHGLQQAYLRLDEFWGGLSMQVGRFELAEGSGRMLDPQDWLQAPFTFDGLGLSGTTGPLEWDFFFTQAVMGQGGLSTDTGFQGFYGTWDLIQHAVIETYALRRRDSPSRLDEWTFGGRAHGQILDGLNWELEAATQSGDRGLLEAGGFLVVTALDYPLDGGHNVGFEWDYASGDRNPTDANDDTFRPLFYDAHRGNGIADVVMLANLSDFVFKYWLVWNERWSFHGDLHWMMLTDGDAGIVPGAGGTGITGTGDKSLGTEVDAYAVGQITPNLLLEFGGAYFMAGDAIAGGDDQFWVFLQVVLSF